MEIKLGSLVGFNLIHYMLEMKEASLIFLVFP